MSDPGYSINYRRGNKRKPVIFVTFVIGTILRIYIFFLAATLATNLSICAPKQQSNPALHNLIFPFVFVSSLFYLFLVNQINRWSQIALILFGAKPRLLGNNFTSVVRPLTSLSIAATFTLYQYLRYMPHSNGQRQSLCSEFREHKERAIDSIISAELICMFLRNLENIGPNTTLSIIMRSFKSELANALLVGLAIGMSYLINLLVLGARQSAKPIEKTAYLVALTLIGVSYSHLLIKNVKQICQNTVNVSSNPNAMWHANGSNPNAFTELREDTFAPPQIQSTQATYTDAATSSRGFTTTV